LRERKDPAGCASRESVKLQTSPVVPTKYMYEWIQWFVHTNLIRERGRRRGEKMEAARKRVLPKVGNVLPVPDDVRLERIL
jgi:DMSO/TMAO reductase YedYZ molybdopterin-dependent catalytic subunit